MLSFFRRNLFINLIFLFLFVVGLQAYFFIVWTDPVFSIDILPDAQIQIGFLSNHILQSCLTIILIIIQAILVSQYVINHKMSRALSYIPGAVFALYASFILENLSFHMILLANLFFILGVGNLYKIYKEFRPVTYIFNAGFFISIASLIYYPYAIMFIVVLLGLLSLRSTNILEILQLIIGFLAGYFLTGVMLYATGNIEFLWSLLSRFDFPSFETGKAGLWLKPILSLIIIIILIFFHSTVEKKRTFDAMRKIDLNYWFLFFGLLSLLFTTEYSPVHLIIISFPIAILGGLILERKAYSITKEFIFLIALGFYFTLVFQLI